ncbi:MAG TPA: ATP-binding cassette domain-containing protein [Acidobacteriaceae bacterium]|nr:ATP-binding cassette domain-containing protein [Acidobacteriaceae bacterium]
MNSPPLAPLVHHHLSVDHRVGALHLHADLNLSAMWTILFGPSGSGKSSLLRAACGLLSHRGIRFTRHHGDKAEVLQDETTFVPPHLRALRWAPQSDSLFPHLSVHRNILFGATAAASKPRDEAEIIALFQLAPLLNRLPRDLSGGERRRVALARAFAAPGCRLMLLDEPFAGIDRALRDNLLPAMRAWLRDRNIPALSVTHDVEEALQLQAEVVLIRDGRIEAQGYASNVLAPERDRLMLSLSRP